MSNIYQTDRIVIVLNGKYAGRKAVILKAFDDGTKERPYSHLVIAGIDKYPRKVTKDMGKKKAAKKSKFSVFVKCMNSNHVFPTRYTLKLGVNSSSVDGKFISSQKNKNRLKVGIKGALVKR